MTYQTQTVFERNLHAVQLVIVCDCEVTQYDDGTLDVTSIELNSLEAHRWDNKRSEYWHPEDIAKWPQQRISAFVGLVEDDVKERAISNAVADGYGMGVRA